MLDERSKAAINCQIEGRDVIMVLPSLEDVFVCSCLPGLLKPVFSLIVFDNDGQRIAFLEWAAQFEMELMVGQLSELSSFGESGGHHGFKCLVTNA